MDDKKRYRRSFKEILRGFLTVLAALFVIWLAFAVIQRIGNNNYERIYKIGYEEGYNAGNLHDTYNDTPVYYDTESE